MRDNHFIRAVYPIDGELIRYLYNILYRIGYDFTFEEFLSCIGDMYIYSDDCGLIYEQHPKVYGIIAAKRVPSLEYPIYNTKNVIKVFHIFRYYDETLYEDIAYHLLDILTIDNNDIPMELTISLNDELFIEHRNILEVAFAKNNFSIKSTDDNSITYYRLPVIK